MPRGGLTIARLPLPTPAVQHALPLTGRGRVIVAAYGLADAEHLVEKEISRLWPEARTRIMAVERVGEGERIAEEFLITYEVRGSMRVEAASPDLARREAFRRARERFSRTRYWRTEWEVTEHTARS